MKHIGDDPLPEMYAPGVEIDCQCARCGSDVDWEPCEALGCGDDGYDEDAEDDEPCIYCYGRGGWYRCMSSQKFCEANPLPGRENVERGTVEWFTVPETP